MRFQNGSNKVAIELSGVQFWSEIILVISNRFEITRMISDQIALHSVQLPLYKLVQKGKKFLNTCKFSQQADKHQHQDLGGGGGREYAIIFWAGVSSVT